MTESKAEFRRSIRQSLPQVDEEAVTEAIMAHPWFQEADSVMAYSAIPPEINIAPILEAVLSRGKTLLLPRCEAEGVMTARKITDLSQLIPGAYGIPEPKSETEVFPQGEIDLILVPGLAFDGRGHRLGRGKGYYDRFLRGKRGKTMGICRCLVPEVPVEDHDIIMDAVITEDKIILCEMEDSACLEGRKS